jgi:hypothetical protein
MLGNRTSSSILHSSGLGSVEWKERGAAPLDANGSNGSSSSSPGLMDERKPEFGVAARGKYDRSGVSGAAMAKLELALVEPGAHKSGDGVSARNWDKDDGLDEAAESGRVMGLNSDALAFKCRGEDRGDAGRLDEIEKWAWMWERTGDWLGDMV